MASRSFLVAALALCALLAGAAAAKPVPPPITNPCAGNMSALSASLTNATNTQLAKTYGQSNTTTTEKPVKFTVPKVCGPLGTCAGGNTYQATAGKTKTIQGAHDITSNWTMTQTSCTNNSGTFTVSGTMNMALTWTQAIAVDMDFFVNGFLGVDLGFSLDTTIYNMAAIAPGTWTLTSTTGVTGTITAINFAGCTISTTNVGVTVNGNNLAGVGSQIASKLSASGPEFCSSLNKKLGPKLVGKTVPL